MEPDIKTAHPSSALRRGEGWSWGSECTPGGDEKLDARLNCPRAGASPAADHLLSPQGLAEAEADHWHPGRGSPVTPTGTCPNSRPPSWPHTPDPCQPACSFRAGGCYISGVQFFDPSCPLTEQGGLREAGVVPVDSLARSSPCPPSWTPGCEASGWSPGLSLCPAGGGCLPQAPGPSVGCRPELPPPLTLALTQPGTHFRSVCRQQMSVSGHREARVTQLAGS